MLKIFYLSIVFGMLQFLSGCSSDPQISGVNNGSLPGCPNTPNCVLSHAKDNSQLVEPFFYAESSSELEIKTTIINVLSKMRAKIVKQDNNYIRAEFKTFLGFIDDVEFYIDDKYKYIQFRSSSRKGYYDFGKNHQRYSQISNMLYQYPEFIPPVNKKIANRVLKFWIDNEANWFIKSPEFDQIITTQFLAILQMAKKNLLKDWELEPDSTLALIILLDQFSRNIFRDTKDMFAADQQAILLTKMALDNKWDQQYTNDNKLMFFYMPLMHSEHLEDQNLCVELFSNTQLTHSLEFAKQHRDIIQEFGRFPHRNILLGRESTAQELEFLKQPGSSF